MENTNILKQNEVAEIHAELKTELRKSLLLGQLSFLNAGKLLTEIKKQRTFLAERHDMTGTWTDFIRSTDIPLPGDTLSSKIRTAQVLMKVYDFFIASEKVDYSNETFAEIGYSKLNLIISPITAKPEEAAEWIERAKEMSYKELQLAIKNNGLTIEEEADCKHDNIKKVSFWKCEDCGQVFHEDPNSSDAEELNVETYGN